VAFRSAAESARRLDAHPDRGRGEIRERDLLEFDDPHRIGVRAGRDGALARLVACFFEHGLPAARLGMKYPVYLSADRSDGGADGVGGAEVFRPDDLAYSRDLIRHENAAAADGDQRAILRGRLHPVDRVGEHRVGSC
jgi:hypothetical protein